MGVFGVSTGEGALRSSGMGEGPALVHLPSPSQHPMGATCCLKGRREADTASFACPSRHQTHDLHPADKTRVKTTQVATESKGDRAPQPKVSCPSNVKVAALDWLALVK